MRHASTRPSAPRLTVVVILGALVAALAPAAGVGAQAVPVDRGLVGAGLLLRQLDGVKRVLVIGAHPDDEDTGLLTALARGHGAQTAYLSLTRGEGGQNLIGPELREGLGMIRTGELVAARGLDGGMQFFTRAFDYGYSKNVEEAFAKWSEDTLLEDVVWVIRTFRPHVIVSVFSGTPNDGHGQHQAAGVMARRGFEAAGDPVLFPEQMDHGARVWEPSKLFGLVWRDPSRATTSLQTGTFDVLLGRSHFQLAMESRSQHRSQDMGVPQPFGPMASGLELVRSRVGEEGGGIFAGIDTTVVGLVGPLEPGARDAAERALRLYREAVRAAMESWGGVDLTAAARPLAEALGALRTAREAAVGSVTGAPDLLDAIDHHTSTAQTALLAVAGVVTDVRIDRNQLVPGDRVGVTVSLWNGGPFPITGAQPALSVPDGWTAVRQEGNAAPPSLFPPWMRSADSDQADRPEGVVPPGKVSHWRFEVDVPAGAQPTGLYYLASERSGPTYRWPADASLWALPFDPPDIVGETNLALHVAGPNHPATPVLAGTPGEFVGVDKATGEYRERVLFLPSITVRSEPGIMVWPLASTSARDVTVVLTNQSPTAHTGMVALEASDGWEVQPSGIAFELSEGAERSFVFSVRPSADLEAGRHPIRAIARTDDGNAYDQQMTLIDYPHIQRTAFFRPARTVISAFPVVADEGLSVGYIMGSGDEGAGALRQIGMRVELLDPPTVRSGEFDRFDVIMLGARAYETRPDLVASNGRLLEFAAAGGTVIVQYNKYEYSRGGFAPYPVDISRPHDRVSDETAPVHLIDPESPVFTAPNRISDRDFDGWIQERGLYFLGEWDSRFTPLMEMADPGEEPKRGALLVASVGEGLYVYTGLAFFRQFPEGVPGAVRLFANLASLRAEQWVGPDSF